MSGLWDYLKAMENFLFIIFNNEVMYYVIVPIVVVLLGWLKNKNDLKVKNKELGYWKIKCRREATFIDIVMQYYKAMLICMIITNVIKTVYDFMKMPKGMYIFLEILYLSVNALMAILILNSTTAKVELLKKGKEKIIFVFGLWFIFGIPLFTDIHSINNVVIKVVFIILLVGWMILLFNSCDTAFILDNRYADIYIKGCEQAQLAEAGSIMKRGDWIIVNRYIHGYEEEIRIKESDIVRIDYYGDPLIMVKKAKLFK